MGYELHITRREHWADSETPDISINEWLAYVNTDTDLKLTNGYDFQIGNETHHQEIEGFCEWTAHPTDQISNDKPWFSYWRGSIHTKNPDGPTIRKMMQMASMLNAKVQGDDGEFYTEEYLTELESGDKQSEFLEVRYKKPWWKFW